MKATLDTNIIIHLYESGLEDILFNCFDEVYVYEHIVQVELKNHGSPKTIKKVEDEIQNGRIILITKADLLGKGVWSIFDNYVKKERLIYETGDLGEILAIALAKTLGLAVLLTDDIKMYGPHYSLMHEIDSDVLPLAFYEVFFISFLMGHISPVEYMAYFKKVNDLFSRPQSLTRCVNKFDKRFWDNPINERERKWFCEWCKTNGVDYEEKYNDLWDAIDKNYCA